MTPQSLSAKIATVRLRRSLPPANFPGFRMPFGSRARFQRNCREWHRAHPRTAPVFSSPPPREERAGVGTRFYGSNPLSMNLTLVGTSRCDVPAREAAGGTIAPLNAARTAQRAVPTRFRGSKLEILFSGKSHPNPLPTRAGRGRRGNVKMRPWPQPACLVVDHPQKIEHYFCRPCPLSSPARPLTG